MADVTPVNGSINLGRQGENIVTRVLLPLSDIRSGDGYAVLFHQRSVDDSPYPVAVEEDGDTLIWTVTDADTAVAGRGKAEMRWIGSHGELAKSQVYKTYVAAALEIPEEVPSGYQKYVDAVAENAKDAKDAAAESRAIYGKVLNSQKKIGETYNATVEAKVKAEEAQQKAESAANGIGTAKDDAAASAETAKGAAIAARQAAQGAAVNLQGAQAAKTAAEEAAKQAQEALTGAQKAKTGAETARGKAEEAAQGVAADREQIGANKSGLESAKQELTATKEQLAETKAALATTKEDLKKAQRAIQFQVELSKGQTWDFEEDTQEAYQRQVPSGAKAGAVMEYGGKTVGWNQLCKNAELASLDGFEEAGLSVLTIADGVITANCRGSNPGVRATINNCLATINHYYYIATTAKIEAGTRYYAPYCNSVIFNVDPRATGTGAFVRSSVIAKAINSGPAKIGSRIATTDSGEYTGVLQMKQPVFIDLTLLYGPGNEPTDTTDPRIAQIEAYAAAHPEYNAGELVSALVDEVDVIGANILRPSGTFPVSSSGITAVRNQDSTITINGTSSGYPFFEVGRLQLKKGTTYFIPSATRIMQLEDGNRIVLHDNNNGFTPDKDYPDVFLEYTIAPSETFSNAVIKPIVSVGALRDYSPYTLTTLPIPDAVKQLPGYGWSAGSVANTIERTDTGWQFVQRVGSVDLGTLEFKRFERPTDFSFFYTDNLYGRVLAGSNDAICSIYNVTTDLSKDLSVSTYWTYIDAKNSVCIRDDAISSASDLSAKIGGKMLYFVLATPITTDITDLMGDSLAPFAVEAGGSITLHHPAVDDGFTIDVPAKVQYITKLSEVSANG